MKRILIATVVAGAWAVTAASALAADNYAPTYNAGRCLVQRNRAASVALLRMLPLGEEAVSPAMLGRAPCAAALAGAPSMVVRGAIAQALYFQDMHDFEMGSPIPLEQVPVPTEASAAGDQVTELYRWGDCVVRNDLDGARHLLRSGVGSPEEGAATGALSGTMSHCLAAGSRLAISAWQLRSVLAQSNYYNFYRMMAGELSVRH